MDDELESIEEYIEEVEETSDRYAQYVSHYGEELAAIDPLLVEMLEHSVMVGIQENEKLVEEAVKERDRLQREGNEESTP